MPAHNRGICADMTRAEEHRYRTYGLMPEEFRALEVKHAGRCGICNEPFKDSKDQHIDHCHTTKVVRGLLCSHCNHGLGKFRDDITLLRRAIEYLEGTKIPSGTQKSRLA